MATIFNMTSNATNSTTRGRDPHLPSMIVFDLDDCLWSPEMHELYGKPTKPIQGILNHPHQEETQVQGVVGMSNAQGETVKLYEGARQVLYDLVTDPKYKDVVIAVASSSLEPSYSYACLQGIEITKGKTMMDVISYHQVGRTGTLTSRKTSHFSELHRESQIAYEDMLFYDDCNWGDHVGDLERAYGVTGQRTPRGLQYSEFRQGLDKFKQKRLKETEAILNMVR